MTQTAQLLKKKKKNILENWMNHQLADETLREDLISNDDLRRQSEELLDGILSAIEKGNFEDIYASEYEQVNDILSDISVTRARQGFSPREVTLFVLSLKQAMTEVLVSEHSDQPE